MISDVEQLPLHRKSAVHCHWGLSRFTPFLAVSKSRSRISDVFHRGSTMQIENDGGSPMSSRQVQLELEKGAEGAMIGLIRSHPHDVLFRSSKIFDVG